VGVVGKLVWTSLVLVLVAVVVGAAAQDRAAQQRPIRLEASDLFIEVHAADRDAGLGVKADGEDWRRLTLRDPSGRVVMDLKARGRLGRHGVTGVTLEGSERPFAELPLRRFKARFPEGRYTFSGTTVEGRRLVGSDRLTHDVPAPPELLAPAEDAVVDPAGTVVSWRPVTRPRGIRIVRYVVVVTAEAADRELVMELGPNATSATIPPGFLARGGEHKVELVAQARGGNQAISEVAFTTSG
jgi:hypothetical protein